MYKSIIYIWLFVLLSNGLQIIAQNSTNNTSHSNDTTSESALVEEVTGVTQEATGVTQEATGVTQEPAVETGEPAVKTSEETTSAALTESSVTGTNANTGDETNAPDEGVTAGSLEEGSGGASELEQSFDVASFFGGIVLSLVIISVAVFGYKFYQSRNNKNYQAM